MTVILLFKQPDCFKQQCLFLLIFHVFEAGIKFDWVSTEIQGGSKIQRLDNSPKVKYSIILWTVQDWKVGNINSICVVLNILCYTLLWRHIYVS